MSILDISISTLYSINIVLFLTIWYGPVRTCIRLWQEA